MEQTPEQLFSLVATQLISTDRQSYTSLRSRIESGQLLKIVRGWYLPREVVERSSQPWEQHAVVPRGDSGGFWVCS